MMQWRNKSAAVTVLWLWPMAAAAQNLPMLNMGYSGGETDDVGPLYERLSKSFRDFPTPEPRGSQNVLDSLPSPKARRPR